MIPIPGFEQVKVVWVRLEKEGFVLYGFLLYTSADRGLVDYIRDGIYDLDVLSGKECAVFVIESPSAEWIAYARQTDHTWWHLFGSEIIEEANKGAGNSGRSKISLLERNIIENNHNSVIIVGDGNTATSLQQIINPIITIPYNRAEAFKVAKHFGLEAKDVPCLIFFKDMNSRVIWKSLLGHLTTQNELKVYFREFFDSPEYDSILHKHKAYQ